MCLHTTLSIHPSIHPSIHALTSGSHQRASHSTVITHTYLYTYLPQGLQRFVSLLWPPQLPLAPPSLTPARGLCPDGAGSMQACGSPHNATSARGTTHITCDPTRCACRGERSINGAWCAVQCALHMLAGLVSACMCSSENMAASSTAVDYMYTAVKTTGGRIANSLCLLCCTAVVK
jgi:hypothetical protein